jgi:hypothetical protein
MICPTCKHDFFALFLTQSDGVYRCRADRDKRDALAALGGQPVALPAQDPLEARVKAKLADKDYGKGRPYVSRRAGK